MNPNLPGEPGAILDDQVVRDLIENALDDTLVIEAAAGTGKTTALISRILRLLSTGAARVTGIVAVTFTEKAAGELKLRLRQEIEGARSREDAAERLRLEDALRNLEDAHISTIHGFCADLLRERPVEAGIDPLFTVLTEPQARRCYDQAFDAWLQEALEDPPEGVRRSLCRSANPGFGAEVDEDGPVERLRRAGWDLVDWRDFPASWTRVPFARREAIDALVEEVQSFAALTAQASSSRDLLYLDTAPARRLSDDLRPMRDAARQGEAGEPDYDRAEAALVDLRRDRDFRRVRKGAGASFGKGISRADVHAAHQRLLQALDAFALDADADLAALLRDELQDSISRYEQLKARQGALDFLDLLLAVRNLLREHDEVRAGFQQRYGRIFVDEFQDTDPLQAEILLLLAADDPRERDWTRVCPVPGKLFIVGDPKQSIYRFRRADVGVYRQVCEQLARQGARRLALTTSFRSVPFIQRAVNAAFAPAMTGDAETLQADYVRLSPSRPQPGEQPSIVALPVPEPYGKRQIAKAAIEKSLPEAVGGFVEWLVYQSGWTVTERRTKDVRVAIEPRHICILFRRFVSYGDDMTRAYVDALEARGIRHLLVGGRAFHDREEIETLRAALAAIEWPDDELSVFATLRGALFALSDEDLFEYRHLPGVRAFHPLMIPESLPERLMPIVDALKLLAVLHRGRNRRPVAETLARLLDATRAHVGFALRRAGEQVLANALHVAELARQYELSGGISFRGFVEELREAARTGQAAEAPIVEEGSDGVRLMTVHKAKGLEFPVVILADPTAKLAPVEAPRHLDLSRGLCALRIGGWSPRDLLLQQPIEQARERAEGVRLAYVAATRARDLLVVPVIGDQPYDGWLGPLDAAVYPPQELRRTQVAAPQCPAFRKDSVLKRPDDEVASASTVCPGLHRFEGGGDGDEYEVVWWDPSVLNLQAEAPFGLRRQELISKDVEPEIVAAAQRRYIDWRDRRTAALESGGAASLEVRTATEWASRRPEPGAEETAPVDVEVIHLEANGDRPYGARFGTLVHAALAAVAFDADAAVVEQVVRTQGRILAASDAEVASAIDAVRSVLLLPIVARARVAQREGTCLRETPVTVTLGGTLVEGVVDLAFESGAGYEVVDFKTDRVLDEGSARYVRQLQVYGQAIAAATGKPVRAVLVHV